MKLQAALRGLVRRVVPETVRAGIRDRHKIACVEVIVHQPVNGCSQSVDAEARSGDKADLTIETARRAADACRATGIEAVVRTGRQPGCTAKAPTVDVHVLAGVTLAEHALNRIVTEFNHPTDLELCYSDGAGVNGQAVILPGHSPDRLAEQMYLGPMLAFRRNRRDAAPTSDWAAAVEQARAAATAAHIPERLYTTIEGWAIPSRPEPAVTVTLEPKQPLVSIVIPTRGGRRTVRGQAVVLVEQAIESIVSHSSYLAIELVVVTTPGTPAGLGGRLESLIDDHGLELRFVHDDRPFNFSNVCNVGAAAARGEVLIFLNDDTEVISEQWIERLVEHALRPEVGAVGAKLLYEDGTIQHAGIWSRGGHPTHRYEGHPDNGGYRGALTVAQNCLAVTGACLAIERLKFQAVGGFSPIFPNSYNDVDLCLKLLDRGWRTVVEPRARLHHYEASTRDPGIDHGDMAELHDRWRWRLNNDPFDNPTHDAALSEELPLSAKADTMSEVSDWQPARYWPLPTMTDVAAIEKLLQPGVGPPS